jgi:hypothetical protein
MNKNFIITRDYVSKIKVPRGDHDWYKHCGIVIRLMTTKFKDSSRFLIQFLVAHIFEVLLFEEKIEVMNYLYSLTVIKENTFEWFLKDYIQLNSILTEQEKTIFIMYKQDKRQFMILDETNRWVETTRVQQETIEKSTTIKRKIAFDITKFYNIIGFIGYGKKNNVLVFKTRDLRSKRDTGARCDEAGKSEVIKLLNKIIGEDVYTSENTKIQKDEDGNVIQDAINVIELCILLEFTLRYFNTIEKDGKKWFLTPEMAINIFSISK